MKVLGFISLLFLSLTLKKKMSDILVITSMTLLMVSIQPFSFSMGWGVHLDKLGFLFLMLNLWLVLAVMTMKFKYINLSLKNFKITIYLLFLFLMASFLTSGIIMFYVFFEVSLVPLMFLIMGWGYQLERIQATFYLVLYTVVGSLPLLFTMACFWGNSDWVMFMFFNSKQTSLSLWLLFFVIFSFFIKLPSYGFHLWLPKAHVEAPVSGSMVLAAILLKMSFYGLFRVMNLFRDIVFKVGGILASFLFVGAFLSSVIALNQSDMKCLVAYSSISHMGTMLGAFFSMFTVAMKGAFIVAIAHGFCSSALFFMVNMYYEQNNSRQIILSGGQNNMSMFSMWWVLFLVVNFAAPPFLSLFGEILIVVQIVFWSGVLLAIVLASSFFVAAFCLFIFSSILHGEGFEQNSSFSSPDIWFLVMSYHFFPLVLLVYSLSLLNY